MCTIQSVQTQRIHLVLGSYLASIVVCEAILCVFGLCKVTTLSVGLGNISANYILSAGMHGPVKTTTLHLLNTYVAGVRLSR